MRTIGFDFERDERLTRETNRKDARTVTSIFFFFLHFVTHPLSVVLLRTNYTAMRLIIADA